MDADVYPQEQWWVGTHGRLHHEYLCQQMFLHATVTGQSETHDYAICWGQREPSPKWDLGVQNLPAMEPICPNSTWEDIEDLYQDMYTNSGGYPEEANVR